jgi:MFS transporter, ACS family, D-galactonate transporter
MNFANNTMGAVAPIVTGAIVAITHAFAGAFLLAGAMLLLGIFSYIYLLGDIVTIAESPSTRPGHGLAVVLECFGLARV